MKCCWKCLCGWNRVIVSDLSSSLLTFIGLFGSSFGLLGLLGLLGLSGSLGFLCLFGLLGSLTSG